MVHLPEVGTNGISNRKKMSSAPPLIQRARHISAIVILLLTAACGGDGTPINPIDPLIPIVQPIEASLSSFFGRPGITLQSRSLAIEPVVATSGCGQVPAANARQIDGEVGDWRGEPTWIAGTGRYDVDEYIWTEYPFDDDGDGDFVYPGAGDALEPKPGTVGRATAVQARYGDNAADVTMVRFAADAAYLYILVELNYLNATDTTVLGFGFDLDQDSNSGFAEWPFEAGISSAGLDAFATIWGDCGALTRGTETTLLDEAGGAVRINTANNVVEIAIPRAALGHAESIRIVGGSGLWDGINGIWAAQKRDTSRVANLLFRDDEPALGCAALEYHCIVHPNRFNVVRQHEILAGGTTGPYAISLDVARLQLGTTEPDPISLRRGNDRYFIRVYRSRIDAEGVFQSSLTAVYLGRYQPYLLYVPDCYESGCSQWPGTQSAPLVMFFHGGSVNHTESGPYPSLPKPGGEPLRAGIADAYASVDTRVGAVVAAVLARGQREPWYRGIGEADVFEALNDVREHYKIDRRRQFAVGGSLGGYASLRMTATHPDVFNGLAPHCITDREDSITAEGAAGLVSPDESPFVIDALMPSLLNLRYRHGAGILDPLAPITINRRLRDAAFGAGLDARYTEYQLGTHCYDFAQALYTWPAAHGPEIASAIIPAQVVHPPVVRYRIDPRQYVQQQSFMGVYDTRELGLDYSAAYWLFNLRVRAEVEQQATNEGAPKGVGEEIVGAIDAVSHVRGGWKLNVKDCGHSLGLGGNLGGNPEIEPYSPTPHDWECQAQDWSGDPEPLITLTTRNLESAGADLYAAGFDAGVPFDLRISSDGPLSLHLRDPFERVPSPSDCAVIRRHVDGVIELDITSRGITCELHFF